MLIEKARPEGANEPSSPPSYSASAIAAEKDNKIDTKLSDSEQQHLEHTAAASANPNTNKTTTIATEEDGGHMTTFFESQAPEWHHSTERRLVRKIDSRLLPFLIVMYLLNFLDRANLAQARQGTLEADLGMTGTDFNLATSIFFVGYLLMQLPSNMLITRLRPSLYLTSAMVLWGGVSAMNAASKKFTDLVVVRFFLGFVEAPFFPGAVFLMSSWYTRAELTRRMAYFYSGNALANMFGGLIGAAVLGSMEGAQGVAGWRWLFIIVRFSPPLSVEIFLIFRVEKKKKS